MPVDTEESTHVLIQRIFLAQIFLIAISAVLFCVAVYVDLGFFWFAFLAGIFGSSVALLRRVQNGDTVLADETLRSWGTALMPFLYGGMMAGDRCACLEKHPGERNSSSSWTAPSAILSDTAPHNLAIRHSRCPTRKAATNRD